MASRCICERSAAAGPSAHRGVVHNIWLRQRGPGQHGRCVHDELSKTVRKFRMRRAKPVPGTRAIRVVESDI